VAGLQILWEMLAKVELKHGRSIFYADSDEIMLRTLWLHSYESLDKTVMNELIRRDIEDLLVHRLGLGGKGRLGLSYVQYIGDNVVRLLIVQVAVSSMYLHGLYFDYEGATGVSNFYSLEVGNGWKELSRETAYDIFAYILYFCGKYMMDINVDESAELYEYTLQQLKETFDYAEYDEG